MDVDATALLGGDDEQRRPEHVDGYRLADPFEMERAIVAAEIAFAGGGDGDAVDAAAVRHGGDGFVLVDVPGGELHHRGGFLVAGDGRDQLERQIAGHRPEIVLERVMGAQDVDVAAEGGERQRRLHHPTQFHRGEDRHLVHAELFPRRGQESRADGAVHGGAVRPDRRPDGFADIGADLPRHRAAGALGIGHLGFGEADGRNIGLLAAVGFLGQAAFERRRQAELHRRQRLHRGGVGEIAEQFVVQHHAGLRIGDAVVHGRNQIADFGVLMGADQHHADARQLALVDRDRGLVLLGQHPAPGFRIGVGHDADGDPGGAAGVEPGHGIDEGRHGPVGHPLVADVGIEDRMALLQPVEGVLQQLRGQGAADAHGAGGDQAAEHMQVVENPLLLADLSRFDQILD